MKQLKFLQIILALTLCAWTSCEEEEKLPGTKPDTLIGKWENVDKLYEDWPGLLPIGKRWRTYEFTKTGGSITEIDYIEDENRYKEPYIQYFTNCRMMGNIFILHIKKIERQKNGNSLFMNYLLKL
jgi:hypothetical protein